MSSGGCSQYPTNRGEPLAVVQMMNGVARSTIQQLLGNLFSGWGTIAIRSIIAFAMVPFLLRHLGTEGFGLVGLLTVIVTWSSVADLGLRSALGRELSEKVAQKDAQGFRVLSSTALSLYVIIALVVTGAGLIAAPWLVSLFKVGEHLKDEAVLMLRVFGSLSMVVAFTLPVLTAGLTSFMRFDVVNMVQGGTSIVTGLLLFALLPFLSFPPLWLWVTIMLTGSFSSLVVMYVLYRRLCYGGKLGLRYLDRSELKPLFSLGGYMYALQMTNNLTERANPLIVSSFLGTVGVALYQSGAKVSQMLRPGVMTFVNQLHPLTTQCHVRNEGGKQKRLFLEGTKYTFMLGSFVALGVLFFAESFCRLWLWDGLGEDYQVVADVMRMIAIVDLTAYARGTQWPILLGMKRLKLLVWAQLPSAFLNIILSIYLVGFTGLGLVGVVYATIVINLIRLPLLTWYVAKCVDVSIWETLKRSYLSPTLCLVVMGACCWGVVRFMPLDSWFSLAVGVSVGAVCWICSVMVIGLNSEERELFLGIATRIVRRVAAVGRS